MNLQLLKFPKKVSPGSIHNLSKLFVKLGIFPLTEVVKVIADELRPEVLVVRISIGARIQALGQRDLRRQDSVQALPRYRYPGRPMAPL